jgi:hypothetical protein
MKPRTRKVWLIVEIAILVIALVSLYVVHSRQVGEREELNGSLLRTQALLPTLGDSRKAAEDQLAAAQSSLNAKKAQFPESVQSIEYDDDLFEIADDYNVDITSITASPPTGTTVGVITYSVSTFTVVVSGAVDDILDFINALTIGEGFQLPWSAEVTSVNTDAVSSATIKLNIYGYKG